jgi:SOS-response transcriptional repressor LexA
VSGTSIKYWEDGTTDPENIRNAALQAAAGALAVTVSYLKTGKDGREFAEAPAGMRLANDGVRSVPLISHVQAGYGVGASDAYARGDGSQEVGVDSELAEKLGRLAFALEIEGESMLEEFRPGDIVIIDPNVRPLPGDFVVAKLEIDESATFKKYRPRGTDEDGQQIYELVPLNEDYEIIRVSASNPGKVIGTMMEHRRRRRR